MGPADRDLTAFYGAATASTTVDYNIVFDTDPTAATYAWGTPDADLAAFQAASSQGAHDRQIDPHDPSAPGIDSANSAAPGFPGQDGHGLIREDDPDVANTGTGPIPFADRGATEVVGTGEIAVTVPPSNAGPTVTVNVSRTTAPWAPAQIVSYQVTYGDGSGTFVVPLGQPASHTYLAPGVYGVRVVAFDTGGGHAGGSIQPFAWTVNTALAATTVTPATVGSGHQLAVGTILTRADTAAPLAGQTVTVEFQPAPPSHRPFGSPTR